MLKKSEDINAILGDPPMESEYAKKKAQKQMESEDRLLEKLQHNNIAVHTELFTTQWYIKSQKISKTAISFNPEPRWF